MATLLEANGANVFIPVDQLEKEEKDRIAYKLRTPLVSDRKRLQDAIRLRSGRSGPVLDSEYYAILRHAIRELFQSKDENFDQLIELIDEFEARQLSMLEMQIARLGKQADILHLEAKIAQAPEKEANNLKETQAGIREEITEMDEALKAWRGVSDQVTYIENMMANNWPEFGDLLQRKSDWEQARAIEHARQFVVGAVNIDLGEISQDGLTDEQLDRIPLKHLDAIAHRAGSLIEPDLNEKKSSPSQSPMH